MTTRSLLRAAGVLAWAFAALPFARNLWREPSGVPPAVLLVWASAFVVFGVAFWRATDAIASGTASAPPTRLLAIQTASALAMLTLVCSGFEATLLVIVAVELGLALSIAAASAWLVAQSIVFFALTMQHMGWPDGIVWSVGAIGFQAFAFTVAAIAGREASARRELTRANAELRAARDDLVRASRDAERVRIARDLHDLLGHDLVALHLNLETARHIASGAALEPIERAHGLAKKLLGDVRDTVTSLREEPRPGAADVAAELRALASRVGAPRVHLDAPEHLAIGDSERANAVVRCVQEVVTNAMKHAAAENVWVELTQEGGRLRVTARDDGRGASRVALGNGLTGMRERFERLGGEMACETSSGKGFHVRAWLPLAGAEK